MRQFVYHRIFQFRIVAASVLWTLVLWNPQPSDGVLQDGWGSFYDHYGENLEHLETSAGDVLMKDNGALILIYSTVYYFQMHTADPKEGDREVQCFFYKYPKRGDNWPRRLKKQVSPPDRVVTVTLAEKLINRFLPFHPDYCNKSHYMRYILYGTLTKSEYFKECPLSAVLIGVTATQIRSGSFKLMDSSGQEHNFSEYNFSRQLSSAQRQPESSKRAKTSHSSNRIERTTSWQQRLNSMRRIASNPFQSSSRKRSRSV